MIFFLLSYTFIVEKKKPLNEDVSFYLPQQEPQRTYHMRKKNHWPFFFTKKKQYM